MILKRGMIGGQVTAWQKYMNSAGYNCGAEDGIFGRQVENATKNFQKDNNLEDDGIVGDKTISAAITKGFVPPANLAVPESKGITLEQLAYIMKTAKRSTLELHLPLINNCLVKFEINTPLRVQHFLAQCGHESGSLKWMHEIASGEAYEGRRDLGNTKPGDGKKFRGHGPIQLTGRNNHTLFFNYIGKPELIDNPRILEEDLGMAWEASGWYWTVFRKINRYADKDDAEMCTRLVNGGLNGYSDRLQYLARAKAVIK